MGKRMFPGTPESRLVYVTENIASIDKEERIVGSFLYNRRQEPIARIDGLLLDQHTRETAFLAITLGGFLMIEGKKALVPRSACDLDDIGKVITSLSAETLRDSPSPGDIRNVTPVEENLIRGYFGL
jgi:hypothetical protein